MGALPFGRVGDDRDDHRLAGSDLRRFFDHPAGGPARLSAAARDPPHLRAGDRPGLRAAHQLPPPRRRHHPRAGLPVIRQSRGGLWHRRQRHDGDHNRSRLLIHAQPRLEPRPRGAGICRFRRRRSDLLQRQSVENRRGRLVSYRRRRSGVHGDGDLVARPAASGRVAPPRCTAVARLRRDVSIRKNRPACRVRPFL